MTLLWVHRRKREKCISVRVRDVLGAATTVRLDWGDALKLAGILLAMLFGTLVVWRSSRVSPQSDQDTEEHEP